MTEKKSGRGGARPGAGRKTPGTGRKRLGDEKRVCKIVTLPPDLWEKIDARGRSKFIKSATEEKLEREAAGDA